MADRIMVFALLLSFCGAIVLTAHGTIQHGKQFTDTVRHRRLGKRPRPKS